MDDYISREAAREDACDRCGKQGHCNRPEFCPVIYSINTIPTADVVARDCYNRILAENDTMREQLAKIGKKPGDSMESVRQVRHAHWVKRDERRGSYLFYCSACGGKAYFAHGQNSRTKKEPFCGYPLCPNCGADMREVTDEP